MTNVIAFRTQKRAPSAALGGAPAADILLFTGVRYMRETDPTATAVVAATDACETTPAPVPAPVTGASERRQA